MIRAEPILRDALLAAARAYAKATKLPLHRVSRLAYGDSGFFEKLARRRGSFTVAKYDEVMAFFADVRKWPLGVVPAIVADPFADQRRKDDE